MSHIVSIKTEVRDATAVAAACQRLGLTAPKQGKATLFQTEAEGLLVQLPGWQYPVVCDLAAGQLSYDDFNGYWGDRARLDQFLQAYAVELAKLEDRKAGRTYTEQPLADGSIKVSIQLG